MAGHSGSKNGVLSRTYDRPSMSPRALPKGFCVLRLIMDARVQPAHDV
jgi:hypothetical protein